MKRIILWICVCLFAATGCTRQKTTEVGEGRGISVVTTLFPVYDMARAIGGSRAEVRLILPPGVEAHNFEPKPEDIININKAALFIYTNRYMEPWAEKLVSGISPQKLRVLDASTGLVLMKPDPAYSESDEHDRAYDEKDHSSHQEGMDPHVWLDLGNAVKMVELIASGFAAADPANKTYFEANAAVYRKRLELLDRKFEETLNQCSSRSFVHAGHFAFGYLANRYRLKYTAATGITADSEPTPARLALLVKQIKKLGIKTIFTEELVSPKLAETIAGETGSQILRLNACHNISREDLSSGVTFPDLMEKNLSAISKGLQCTQ